jgi:hypothetical protein
MEALLMLIVLIAVALAAPRWGVYSGDGPDSPEWERRRRWRGFTHVGR